MAKAKEEESFEKNLDSLESIVSALEEGGLSLDDALKQFESGITLARRCEKALSDAEKKIEILTQNAEGELVAEPFDESEEPAAPAKTVAAPAAKTTSAPPAPKAAAVPAPKSTPAPPRAAASNPSEPEPTPEPDDEDLLF